MGAVANRAGELFAGIVAEVPFVDVLNTMLDDTLPLTPPEWPEWGNPIESEKDFRTILSYSPYDNVAAKALSGDPGDGRADRSARHLLGAGEMDRATARDHDRRRPGAAAHQHGRRPWRRIRAASTGSTKSRSSMRSRCGRWGWRIEARGRVTQTRCGFCMRSQNRAPA